MRPGGVPAPVVPKSYQVVVKCLSAWNHEMSVKLHVGILRYGFTGLNSCLRFLKVFLTCAYYSSGPQGSWL